MREHVRVVAVDPGKATGIARVNIVNGQIKVGPWGLEVDDTVVAAQWVRNERPDLIVVENFVPRGGAKTWQPDALHLIGMLKYIAHIQDCAITLQSPADAKRWSSDAKLKQVGWWEVSKSDHVRDALRHLLLAVTRHQLVDVTKLLRGDE